MANWSIMKRQWPPEGTYDPYDCGMNYYYQEFLEQQKQQPGHQHPPPQLGMPMQHPTTSQQHLPQGMFSPQLMNSSQQMMPHSMMLQQLSSQQLMPPEETITSQSELMFPQQMMGAQPMIPHRMSINQLTPSQMTSQEQMISSQMFTPEQLLSPDELLSPPQLMPQPQTPQRMMPQLMPPAYPSPDYGASALPRGDSPRELRNKAEKQRRDKLNHSISELASMVPPVAASNRKIDKTGVLRLTAHYLRAFQYVFGDSIWQSSRDFSASSAQALLSLMNGFLLTTTYRGLVVVVSQNIQQYLGYSELDLLGHSIFNYVHPEDIQIMQQNLMPNIHLLGPNGELLLPEDMEGRRRIAAMLAGDKRRFMVRFKKLGQRSEPTVYVPCYVEGSLRKSDRASRTPSRYCQVVRRARARGETPYSSGNDVVFIGIVRPTAETFVSERHIEEFRMEYRTRHSVDGEIMECEQRISLVAGYMTHEVNGVNAMHFMHRDDVRWVIFTLREMYDHQQQVGESCYRLMAKNGQFLYMKTRGVLDIDERSKAVRSMVCTNTVVDEKEGKHLIRLMKQKCLMMINSHRSPTNEVEIDNINLDDEDQGDQTVDQTLPLQDLEKVIHTLITNLPSPHAEYSKTISPLKDTCLLQENHSPQKKRLLSAISQIFQIINKYREMEDKKDDQPKRSVNNLVVPIPTQATQAMSPSRRIIRRLTARHQRDMDILRQVEGLPTEGVPPAPLSEYFAPPPTPKRQRVDREFKDTNSTTITTFGVKPNTVHTYVKGNDEAGPSSAMSSPPVNYGASSSTTPEPMEHSMDIYIEHALEKPELPYINELLELILPDSEAHQPMETDNPFEDLTAANNGEEAATVPIRPNFLPIIADFEYPAAHDPSISYLDTGDVFLDPNVAFPDIDSGFLDPAAVSHQGNAAEQSNPEGTSHALLGPENESQRRGNMPNGTDRRRNRKNKKNNEFMI